jgi:hypothetical protein
VRGLKNSELTLSTAAGAYRRFSERIPCAAMTATVVLCFSKSEDAGAFAERFAGELLRAAR